MRAGETEGVAKATAPPWRTLPSGVRDESKWRITEAGRAHLEENREMIDNVLDHLERFGRKMAKARDWFGWNDDGEDSGRRGRHEKRDEKRDRFRALRHRLRAALSDIVDAPEDRQAEAIRRSTGPSRPVNTLRPSVRSTQASNSSSTPIGVGRS